jgi:ABC-type phosphate transport system substrate-binding protein
MTPKHRRALHGVAAAVSVCALAAPTASAVPAEQFLQDAEDGSAGGSSSVSPPPSSIAASAAEEYENLRAPDGTTVPVRVVKVRADGGFDWGDAGIGATGMLALTAIGVGAAFALGQGPGRRHMPQPIR